MSVYKTLFREQIIRERFHFISVYVQFFKIRFDLPSPASDTDIQISQSQPINSSSQISSLVTKCDSYRCNSSTPYQPIRESELVLTTIDKRIGG
jgi:hypothetical protein